MGPRAGRAPCRGGRVVRVHTCVFWSAGSADGDTDRRSDGRDDRGAAGRHREVAPDVRDDHVSDGAPASRAARVGPSVSARGGRGAERGRGGASLLRSERHRRARMGSSAPLAARRRGGRHENHRDRRRGPRAHLPSCGTVLPITPRPSDPGRPSLRGAGHRRGRDRADRRPLGRRPGDDDRGRRGRHPRPMLRTTSRCVGRALVLRRRRSLALARARDRGPCPVDHRGNPNL